jgi:pimeloyl-ACP methyl ester carboxylesterase
MSKTNSHFPLYSIIEGKGQPVIMIHGLAASMFDWVSLLPTLVKAGYCGVAVDILGHGDSFKPEDPHQYIVQEVYLALEAWLDHLNLPQPYILVGHSLGGYLSLAYTLQHPEAVQALVLAAPFFTIKQTFPLVRFLSRKPSFGSRVLQATSPKLIEKALGWDPTNKVRFSPQARMQIALDYKRASPHILNIPFSAPDLTHRLDEIKQPILLTWGDRDMTLRAHYFPQLLSLLPNATGQIFHGSGHQPHVAHPDQFNHLVLNFLAQHAPSDGNPAAHPPIAQAGKSSRSPQQP